MKISKKKLKQIIQEELINEAFGGHAARVGSDPRSHSYADAVRGHGRPDPAAELQRKKEKDFRQRHQSQKADLMKKNSWLELEETRDSEGNEKAVIWEEGFWGGIKYADPDNFSNYSVPVGALNPYANDDEEAVGDDELWEDDKYSAGYVDPAVEFAEQNHGRRVYVKGEDKYGVVVGADECGFEETCVEVEMPGQGVTLVDVSRLQLIGGPRGMGEQQIYEDEDYEWTGGSYGADQEKQVAAWEKGFFEGFKEALVMMGKPEAANISFVQKGSDITKVMNSKNPYLKNTTQEQQIYEMVRDSLMEQLKSEKK